MAVTLSFQDPQDSRIAGTRELSYFLGSGHLGTTYLYLQDGYLLESPVAWYASTQSYDMKPGYGHASELPPAIPMQPGCLRCHMSGVASPMPGSENRYAGLPFRGAASPVKAVMETHKRTCAPAEKRPWSTPPNWIPSAAMPSASAAISKAM